MAFVPRILGQSARFKLASARASPNPAGSQRIQRWIGEQAGLSALADKSRSVRRHDALGPGSVGDTIVDGYAAHGFRINGVSLHGPVLLLPRASFLLAIDSFHALTTESLAVLDVLHEPAQVLVIGCGSGSERIPSKIRTWSEQRGIAIEALATPHACSTFNFMVQEQRVVAAILFPTSWCSKVDRVAIRSG